MADRSHVSTSLPCPTPGCTGYLKCHGGSKLVPYEGRTARSRLRECEICHCKAESVESIIRVINTGKRVSKEAGVLSERRQRSLF